LSAKIQIFSEIDRDEIRLRPEPMMKKQS